MSEFSFSLSIKTIHIAPRGRQTNDGGYRVPRTSASLPCSPSRDVRSHLISQYLKQLLPDSAEEHRFLETALHALQRRSGPVQHPPDEFTITSLDVVICYNRKLGQGGFTTVYEGLWKGRRVAVKVMDLEKRISPSVSARPSMHIMYNVGH